MDLRDFLEVVVTAKQGWLNLSYAKDDGSGWTEEWYNYPEQVNDFVNRANSLSDHNVYFSPYLFQRKESTKDSAITGRTIVADLDEANVLILQHKPTVLVETSYGRHQGYWILDKELESKEHEHLSKRLTYSIPGCDKTGWFVSKKVRVPGTHNFKWGREEDTVKIVASTGKIYQTYELDVIPDVPTKNGIDQTGLDAIISKGMKVSSGPQEYFASIRNKLPPAVVTQYNVEARDRSKALWALMVNAFRAGLNTEQVFFLARGSANNKFTGLRFNGDRELAKDVLRAKDEAYSGHSGIDLREKIKAIRNYPGTGHEKLSYMAQVIREDMKTKGQFIRCSDGTSWYIDNHSGHPIPIVQRAESLQNLLDKWYGLNSTERESSYAISNLVAYVSDIPSVGKLGSMTYYDTDNNTLLIHTGRKDVLAVSKQGVTTVADGYSNIVFPWSSSMDVINPHFKHNNKTWDDIMFDDALNNVVGLTKAQAKAMLKVWLIMLLMRNLIVSRPILAIFGQPGAGKSTLFRRIYTFLYGRGKSLSSITSPDNFDYATAADPLVVFDNVDTWEKWLPDRLALAAAVSEIVKRKLYTNNETITLTRQAFLGITAHNPKFGREDVTDRLVIITLERLSHFSSETEIIQYIADNRSAIWGMVIQDIVKVLNTPVPTQHPQFRIEDFAKYGTWVADGVGCRKEFVSAIESIAKEQKAFNLEEDQLLIDAIGAYLSKNGTSSEYKTPSQWWATLEPRARDQLAFQKSYKNAVVLGKKLWTIQDSLRSIYDVDWSVDKKRSTRIWKFSLKEKDQDNGTKTDS